MRVVLHLSDLHFGRIEEQLVSGVLRSAGEIGPHVVAVSGDLTQRARAWQFKRAAEFLTRLPGAHVVVPGNHDVPLYNLAARLGWPLRGFTSHITRDLRPFWGDAEIAVVGANTTRSLTIQDGGFRPADVHWMTAQLRTLDPAVVKIVVCHHPFDIPSGRIGRFTRPKPAAEAMTQLIAAGADVFLTGHLHRGYAGGSAHRYNALGVRAVVVEAGTATSRRTRDEPNSFNVLRVAGREIQVERHEWSDAEGGFAPAHLQMFRKNGEGWDSC